jgi:DNA-binding NtrC family response regulator
MGRLDAAGKAPFSKSFHVREAQAGVKRRMSPCLLVYDGDVSAGSSKDIPTTLANPPAERAFVGPLKLVVVSGPDRGRSLALAPGRYVVGKAEGCELLLSDALVSRRHLEVDVDEHRVRVRDLGSSNGSHFEGARFEAITLGVGSSVTLGETELRLVDEGQAPAVPPAAVERFGGLLGRSTAMRQVFTILERVAATDTAVLLQGETGVGKDLAAEALHKHSLRKDRPFVVCDLAGVTRSLIESELFGHVRGAFTGADRDRDGAFVQADGGTIFLDEVGDLDPDVQPRLLRVLERRQVKPVGGTNYQTVNVRVVAATNRDLLTEVREGRFRRDLYHRLAVVRIEIPPLRHRPEDIAIMAEHCLDEAAKAAGRPPPRLTPETISLLGKHDWPGNVRELRNVLEQALSLSPGPTIDPRLLSLPEASLAPDSGGGAGAANLAIPFKEARERLIEAWEREYLNALIAKAGGNVSLAARRAGLSRVYLHELIKKHAITR